MVGATWQILAVQILIFVEWNPGRCSFLNIVFLWAFFHIHVSGSRQLIASHTHTTVCQTVGVIYEATQLINAKCKFQCFVLLVIIFFMSSDWNVQYFSVIKVAGQKLFLQVTGNIWIYCKYLNESDFLLSEGRTKNSIFYEGQVWKELGDMNCEIKLTK